MFSIAFFFTSFIMFIHSSISIWFFFYDSTQLGEPQALTHMISLSPMGKIMSCLTLECTTLGKG